MRFVFIDETGHPKIKGARNINNERFFGIVSVIVDALYFPEFNKKINEHKIKHTAKGRQTIIHLEDRKKKKHSFNFLKKQQNLQKEYFEQINRLLDELDFKIISVFIDKLSLLEKYGPYAYHPLAIALEYLIERLQMETKPGEEFIIFMEHFPLKSSDFENHTSTTFEDFINLMCVKYPGLDSFNIVNKHANLNGLQIADIVSTPIKRTFVESKKDENIDPKILLKKLAKSADGNIEGFGLKIFPK